MWPSPVRCEITSSASIVHNALLAAISSIGGDVCGPLLGTEHAKRSGEAECVGHRLKPRAVSVA